MATNSTFPIMDKAILTKIANTLHIDATHQVFQDNISINARLSYTSTGSVPGMVGGDVFYDQFNLSGSLVDSGSLQDKIVSYVCNAWNITLK